MKKILGTLGVVLFLTISLLNVNALQTGDEADKLNSLLNIELANASDSESSIGGVCNCHYVPGYVQIQEVESEVEGETCYIEIYYSGYISCTPFDCPSATQPRRTISGPFCS